MAPRQLKIHNWAKYQHYKHRNPPWIKLHAVILQSEDWVMLADASKLLAVVCMVIAAKHDGQIPDSPDYIKRVAYLDKRPNLKPLIDCGFLEILQADESESKQLRTNAEPESESESELEKKVSKYIPIKESKNTEFEKFWGVYPKRVDKIDALKAFKLAVKTTAPEILVAGAIRYAKFIKREKTEVKYIKGPAAWIRAGKWMDEEATKTVEDNYQPPSGVIVRDSSIPQNPNENPYLPGEIRG